LDTGSATQDTLRDDLLWFLERPSVTGEEAALCDDLEARIGEAPGWNVERAANNLVVTRSEPDVSRERVVLAGHLDTVPEPAKGLRVRFEDGLIYGRGATDMKAGDAVMLSLLERFTWNESDLEPVSVFYEREEGPFAENGLETVFSQMPHVLDAGLALLLEPTEGALEAGCIGTAQVGITFKGRSAHSARPWLGKNAVTAAGGLLAELHARGVEAVEAGGLTFHEVLSVTMARGGTATNVVPDEFWINVNHRFAPGRGEAHVRETFESLLEGHEAEYEIRDLAPSSPVALDAPLVQRLIRPSDVPALEVRPKQAWTDVARFAERGVPAANFGPGIPAQAHQDAEHTELRLLSECYGHLESFLRAGSV
jgi:succinyl-diaminopimelate desuccinylase